MLPIEVVQLFLIVAVELMTAPVELVTFVTLTVLSFWQI
jgi:hypothetical protein